MASNLAARQLLKEPGLGPGKRKDRIEVFLKKLAEGETFKTITGGQVKLKHTTHLESVLRRAQKDRRAANAKELDAMPLVTIPASAGPVYLRDLAKSTEFGGSGAGANTKVQESANALYTAARFSSRSSTFRYTDEALEKALSDVDLGTFQETEKLMSKSLSNEWQESCIKTANAIYAKYGTAGKRYTFHRGSSWVKKVEKTFSMLNKQLDEDDKFTQINKWTPADIWMVEDGFTFPVVKDILSFNQEILKAIKNKKAIGVSLKQVSAQSSKAVIDEVNFTTKRPNVQYHSYSVDGRGNNFFSNTNVQVAFSVDGTVQYRTFGSDDDHPIYSGEIIIKGSAARHGKIGLGEISKFYRLLTRDTAPQYDTIRRALASPTSRDKFFRNWHRMALTLSSDSTISDYKKFYDRAANHPGKLLFIFSKYIGTYILYHLLQKQRSDKTIMTQFISKCYLAASSQTALSAPFIKVH